MRLNAEKLEEIFAFFDAAGLRYRYRGGKMTITLSDDTLNTLLEHGLVWPDNT